MLTLKTPSEKMVALLKGVADQRDHAKASANLNKLAKALTLPLKQGVLKGDILDGIYEPVKFDPGIQIEFPLDFLNPGSEKNFMAYTVPSQGRIPERHVEGDYVAVPTYEVAASIDCAMKYLRDGRWDIMGRVLQVLEGSFVRKMNDDGWRTILAAAVGRGIVVFDDQTTAGLFTKRLIALGKTIMRRNAGGNSTSINRGKLTDLYLSPESIEDIRSWDLTQVDNETRRQIFLNTGEDNDSPLAQIFGVNLHDIDEFGVGQVYQSYYTSTLGGTLPGSKLEMMIGLDLSKQDSFIMPVRQEIEIFEDPNFHRQRRVSFYGFGEHGFSVLDSRRTLVLAC